MELFRTHRPQTFAEVVGQDRVCRVLKKQLEEKILPKVILFVGPSGSGKTTIARILAGELGCVGPPDLTEKNIADARGIDLVREIDDSMTLRPMRGESRVWILDEAIQLPTITQKAFLKVLEEPSATAWLFFCTTETTGLLPTFLSRCTIHALNPLTEASVMQIVGTVLKAEGRALEVGVANALFRAADGNARNALKLLETVLALGDDPKRQMKAIEAGATVEGEKGEFLGRLLIRKANWGELYASAKDIEEKDIEGIRRQILGYMAKCMNGRTASWAAAVIAHFDSPFYQSGKAGFLVALFRLRGEDNRQ